VDVTLVEMRPQVTTAAHTTEGLAELVCSNSFKSLELTRAQGLLKAEARLLGSLLMEAADGARIPGGAALIVDRRAFSREVTERIESHPRIRLRREEVRDLASPAVIATGPLTSGSLAEAIRRRLGADSLAFYDAIAPIVGSDSLDHGKLYLLSRYGKGEGDDYLNAPLSREEYEHFIDELLAADRFAGHVCDDAPYFEGCLPLEEMARRGRDTPRFGPLKPVGLPDPRTGREPHAVVQLRREDRAGQMWNLVGFQTRLRIPEQGKVFRLIPGLEEAEFLRWGSIHRNTYLNAPLALTAHLSARDDERLLFAGQLTGVEGYTESLATGILAGINMGRLLREEPPLVPPPETMLGALMNYLNSAEPKHFQPMNANFGLLPPLEKRVRNRRERYALLSERALEAMRRFAGEVP
jgi:methylenetetrahydrofolate--tRNA-(uracil-5-)-methyltransferase